MSPSTSFFALGAALLMATTAEAFVQAPSAMAHRHVTAVRRQALALRMSVVEEQAVEAAPADVDEQMEPVPLVEEEIETPQFGASGFFQPNANMRYGASRDQDGKSNVWAIEPKMAVDTDDKSGALSNGFAVLAASLVVVAGVISQLPSAEYY
ncbi:hypothetical protein JKP88DRAFT_265094 [Tribonema minus]|uniref:Uncharacterized protein n=1 Tax=Tribonema minus TaxID=303371 RepID=A0A835YKW3_9STRA|nr:hypothetical protein JKP88DRAFT_265094 [Tribonema minus]